MIAVHANAQGRGLGKALLTNILKEVNADKEAEGIGLDTENPDNMSLYEHFGFSLVETLKIDALTIYRMFRPRSEGDF